ncbi:cysteine--tRNA ligase [Nonomuraea wenchangensis]
MLRIHDTRAGQVVPVQFGRLVRIYTCGPAVHRRAHVGDLRTYVLSDLVRRVLERRRARVLACQNISDIGHPTGVDHADAFRADATALNIRPPEHAPRASENVEPMVELIAKLVERGHAYAVPDGSVFFDVRTFPGYGELSGDRLEGLRPADWALWKPGDGEPTWDSPWGRGFPGRHVECSAMSLRFLGPVVDLHLGGIDRRFPHHEDERAQSDAVTGHEVVRHWVHGEHLLFDGRTMAESTGNVVLLPDVTAAGLDPLAVRMAFLEHHYRRRLDLTWDALRAADGTLRRWRSRVAEWAESPSAPMAAGHVERVESALGDDLDTPAALRVLRELERDESVPPGAKLEAFLHVDQVLGLDLPIDIGKAPTLPPGQTWA